MTDFSIPGFTVSRKIGEGSFAEVFECQHNDTLRMYAAKVFSPSIGEDLVFSGVFHEILGKAASIVHPNLTSFVDTGQIDLNYYIVTEKLKPWPDYFKGNEPGRSGKILDVVKQLAWTMDFLWKKRVLHCGLKPENILFNSEEQPIITDLLISSVLNSRRAKESVNSLFKSPEQILGKGGVDCRSDIYCLGLVFYRMLTGHIAYIGSSPIDIENKHLVEAVPKLPKQFSEFQPFLEGLMAKKVEDRFQNWGEVLDALEIFGGVQKEEEPISLESDFQDQGDDTQFELDTSVDEDGDFDNEAGVMYDEEESVLQKLPDLLLKYKFPLIGAGVLLFGLILWLFWGEEEPEVPVSKPAIVNKKPPETVQKDRVELKESMEEDPVELALKETERKKREAIGSAEDFEYPVIHIDELIKRLKGGNFADKYYNKKGDYPNQYSKKTIKGGTVVVDSKSGLMWMQDGSEDYYLFEDAEVWAGKKREEGFAGFHDWRIPDFEEAATILENSEKSGSLFLDPVFSGKQRYIWVGNRSAKKDYRWAVDFYGGDWSQVPDSTTAYVILVRKTQ